MKKRRCKTYLHKEKRRCKKFALIGDYCSIHWSRKIRCLSGKKDG